MPFGYKEVAEKHKIHESQAVALEAVASVTPLLMLKISAVAVATFTSAIIAGLAKGDIALVKTLYAAYDDLLKKAYSTITSKIIDETKSGGSDI